MIMSILLTKIPPKRGGILNSIDLILVEVVKLAGVSRVGWKTTYPHSGSASTLRCLPSPHRECNTVQFQLCRYAEMQRRYRSYQDSSARHDSSIPPPRG